MFEAMGSEGDWMIGTSVTGICCDRAGDSDSGRQRQEQSRPKLCDLQDPLTDFSCGQPYRLLRSITSV